MKVRSIPPITSTGCNRRKPPSLLNGLAHISLGRYMSEMSRKRKNDDENDSWSTSKFSDSEFNRKAKNKIATPASPGFEKNIICSAEILKDYNNDGDFAISLRFQGIEFSGDAVASYENERAQRSFLIPVRYISGEIKSCLILTTFGDIFEYEVVRDVKNCSIGECFMGHTQKGITATGEKESCPNRLFRDEAYIPELLEKYDSMSMHVALIPQGVIVTYKKRG